MFRKSFLGQAWLKSKIAFSICCIFLVGNAITHFSKIEVTPFFLWAHYSDAQDPLDSYERIYIKVNDKLIDLSSTPRPTREMIQLPIEHFVLLESRGFESSASRVIRRNQRFIAHNGSGTHFTDKLNFDSDEKDEFLSWLSRYVAEVYDLNVASIEFGTCDAIMSGTEANKSNYRQHAYFRPE